MKVKVIKWVAVSMVAFGVLAAIGMGYLYGGVKSPQETVAVSWSVCSPDIIERYNKALQHERTDDADKALKVIVDEISSFPDAKKDPNCVFMQLTYALQQGHVDGIKRFGGELKELANKDLFITGRLYNAAGFDATMLLVDQADSFKKSTDEGEPKGNG